jgi:hypothetical protein
MVSGNLPRARADDAARKPQVERTQAPDHATNEIAAAAQATATFASATRQMGAPQPPPPNLPGASLLYLQRTAGNKAIARMIAARRRPGQRPIRVSRKAVLDEEWSGPAPEADPNDVDVSEFTSDPRAAAELAKKPAPALPKPPAAPTGPPPPAKPKVVGKVKPSPKPPGGPKKKTKGGPASKAGGKGAAGAIVKKPAPPPPPKYRFVPGMEIAAPPALEKRSPSSDPAFAKVAKAAKMTVKKARKHPTGKQEGDAAQLAAKAPPNDKDAQAEAAHADTMASAKPKEFSADDFYKSMKAALEASRPKNLKEATNLEAKAAGMQDAVKGTVDASKGEAAKDVKEKSEQAPDPSKATPKPEAPMTKTEIAEPEPMKASAAMPAPVPAEQVDLRAGPAQVDQEMADAEVSEEQLKQSNEPEFTGALQSKKEGEEHADKAPLEVRKKEAAILNKATADAAAAEKTAVGGAQSQISAAVTKVAGGKEGAKTKDEVARKEVADNINKIYDGTKKDVDAILDGLDTKVEQTFEREEARIRKEFTNDWNRRLAAYKSRRYSGLRGKWRWVRDKFKGLPEAANKEYEASQKVYEANMDKLARKLSTLVAGELNAATRRIQQGRNEVATYVGSLKGDLAKIGQEAAAELSDKFDELDAGVKDKFDDLAKSLGKKYAESEEAVKKEIEEAKEANKGLIDKAIGAVKGVINTIRNLKDMLLNVLAKAVSVIGDILANPIKFVRNLFSAIAGGVQRFADNILDHLKKGLMGWLFGALGAANIEIPETFDVKGIFQLVTSVLGMTWNAIRGLFVKRIGEPAMNALEKGSSLVQSVVKEGPMALFDDVMSKMPDFEDLVLTKIKDLIVDKVVVAGITFLLSMLNPASAFIKACKMIYDVIRWLIDNGDRIKDLINTIIDSVADIARGGVGGIPQKIEGVLAKILPMAIGFFASLVGMGGIGKKVSEIVDRVRKPITKALDKVVDGVVKFTKPIWGPVVKAGRKLYEKGKAGVQKAKAWAKEKAEKGKAWAKGKAAGAKAAVKGLFKKQQKPLAMKGTGHTLIANPTGGGTAYAITMKSTEKLLSAKVAEAIASLKERKQSEQPEEQAKTQKQIDQLTFIGKVAADMEKKAAAAGLAQVGPTGAPAGFEGEMGELASLIEKYSNDTGERDIGKVAPGTQVNLEMLAKFGMPVASYLQAQDVSDGQAAIIDIRASNVEAPKLLAGGALPKSEKIKTKTVNDEDVALGIPAAHKGKAAWFLPHPLPSERPEKFTEAAWSKIADRWRQRRQEYFDFQKDIGKQMSEGQLMLLHATTGQAASGGVLLDGLKDVAYTGDHDVYRVHPEGKEPSVINALKPAPFRVQHGAHVSWPNLPEVLKKGGMSEEEKRIYDSIIKKHAKGGEPLLRINPKAPPTTASSEAIGDVPEGGGGAAGAAGPTSAASGNELVDVPKPDFAGGAPELGTGEEQSVSAFSATEDFTVEGESHTLTATVSDEGVEVTVASANPRTIARWLQEARDALERLAPNAPKRGTDLVELCERVARSKSRLDEIAKAIKQRAAGNNVKTAVDAQLKGVVGPIKAAMAAKMQLARTKQEKRNIPAGIDIRRTLYCGPGSGWATARENIIALDVPNIVDKIAAVINGPGSASTKAQALRNLTYRGEPVIDDRLSELVAAGRLKPVELRKAKYWHVDHVVPLAAHWQTIGFNSDDATRWAAATNAANLKLIARSENVGFGSEYKGGRFNYAPHVGDDFITSLAALGPAFRRKAK